MFRRKYDVKLTDGRYISRQWAHELRKQEEDPEAYKEMRREKRRKHAEKNRERTRKWAEKFEKENGMSYYQWRKKQLEEDDEDTDE